MSVINSSLNTLDLPKFVNDPNWDSAVFSRISEYNPVSNYRVAKMNLFDALKTEDFSSSKMSFYVDELKKGYQHYKWFLSGIYRVIMDCNQRAEAVARLQSEELAHNQELIKKTNKPAIRNLIQEQTNEIERSYKYHFRSYPRIYGNQFYSIAEDNGLKDLQKWILNDYGYIIKTSTLMHKMTKKKIAAAVLLTILACAALIALIPLVLSFLLFLMGGHLSFLATCAIFCGVAFFFLENFNHSKFNQFEKCFRYMLLKLTL